ncbi:MAG: hypothetical protein KKG47_07650 [Proteobacteria bacterium]|nr:hypothetical protein [Pseudomonadota bacterium]MBU1738390.1 hypothetical protein [Pseudomonadota bacterium]
MMEKSRILKPTFIRNDDRGLFVEITHEGPWETVIHGSMQKGASMGNHYHRECRAFFYLVSGKAEISIRNIVEKTEDVYSLGSGEGIKFLPYECHEVRYCEDSDFVFLKSYRYDPDNPDIYPPGDSHESG